MYVGFRKKKMGIDSYKKINSFEKIKSLKIQEKKAT